MLGFILISLSALSQNQKYADSLKQYLDVELDNGDFDLLFEIAFNETDPAQLEIYSIQLLQIAEKPVEIYRATYLMGMSHRLKGNLDEAINLFFKSAELAQGDKNSTGTGQSYLAIGDIYANNGDHKNSIDYYNKSIRILEKGTDSIALASALLNTGYEYYLSNEYDSALSYYRKSGDLFELMNYDIGVAYNLGNSGLVYAKLENTKLAETTILDATKILEEYEDSYAITEFKIELAQVFLTKKIYETSERFALEALNLAKNHGLKKRIRDASLKLSELYQATGDYQKAYNYQSQYIAYRDSINNEETIRKMADLRTEYEVGQKQAEVDLANAEKEAQAKQALIVGGGLVVVLLLIGIIAVIQFRNNQQKKATNLILTQQKNELETQKAQLESLNSTKDRFFSIISHDLRGPVNAFFGVSKLIKMYVSKGKVNEITEIAEDIDESVSKLSGLLDNLLDWAVQQQGQFPNVPEKINFNDMANDLIQVFDTMAKSKNIELINDLPDKVALFVDKNSTMTIFRNLINNALKFTEEGGKVTIHGNLDQDVAVLKVTDTGVGIPQEKLKKLFTLNEKKSTWGTAGEKGLGLGLQLAYEFAEMNKGSIEVESTEGVGTNFIVRLPVFETEDVRSSS